MKTQTLAGFLFDYLYHKGVKHAFGIPGDFALSMFRALEASPIELFNLTHEPSVGFAADGYARVHGLGVACVTYCVGGLNMLNAVACAYAEKSPLLVISGGPSPNDRRVDGLIHHKVKTFDTQRRIFDEVTCASAVLLDPETAPGEIIRVVEEVLKQSRPGYIELPFDLVEAPVKPPVIRNQPAAESDREMLEEAIREAETFINNAKKPIILAGVELHRYGLTDYASKIAQKFNIPIAADMLSKSTISETNPLYIGVYSGALSEEECQTYVDESDCVIMLGTLVYDIMLGIGTAKLTRKKSIHVTSEKCRIGMHAYEGVLFKDFLEGLSEAKITQRAAFKNPNPVKEVAPLKPTEKDDKLTVESMFRIFGLKLPEGATLVCDTGDALTGALSLRTSQRKNFLSDAYYLSMGFAVPAAIGVMAGKPEGRVFALVGDGAFQMTGTELSTCARYKMAPIVIVINNDGYGTQRHILDGPFNNITMWDYTKIPELIRYGKSVRVDTKGAFDAALQDALASKELSLIEVVVPRDDCSVPLKRLGEELGKIRDSEKKRA